MTLKDTSNQYLYTFLQPFASSFVTELCAHPPSGPPKGGSTRAAPAR